MHSYKTWFIPSNAHEIVPATVHMWYESHDIEVKLFLFKCYPASKSSSVIEMVVHGEFE